MVALFGSVALPDPGDSIGISGRAMASGTLPYLFNSSLFSSLWPGRGTLGVVELDRENSIFSGAPERGSEGAGGVSAARAQEKTAALEKINATLRKIVLPNLIKLFLILESAINVKRKWVNFSTDLACEPFNFAI